MEDIVKMRTKTVRDILELGIAGDSTTIFIMNSSKIAVRGCLSEDCILSYCDCDCKSFGYVNERDALHITLDE